MKNNSKVFLYAFRQMTISILITFVLALAACSNSLTNNDMKKPENIVWMTTIDGVSTSPVFTQDNLYIGSGEFDAGNSMGKLLSINSSSGQINWSSSIGEVIETPIIIGEKVYVNSINGGSHLFNNMTGEKVNHFILGAKALSNGEMIIAIRDLLEGDSFGTYIVAFDARSGEEKWKQPVSNPSMTLSDNVLFFSDFNGQESSIHALEAISGDEKWSFSGGNTIYGTPVVEKGILLLPSSELVVTVDPKDGKEIKRITIPNNMTPQSLVYPASKEGFFYFTDDLNTIHAVDVNNSNKLWSYTFTGSVTSPLSIGDENVYFGTEDGKVVALSRNDGKQEWEFQTKGTIQSITIKDGRGFVVATKSASQSSIDNESYVMALK